MNKIFSLTSVLVLAVNVAFAQAGELKSNSDYFNSLRTISTAVPIISISPDSRAGGMGDVGVASDPDVNSMYWNPAKLAFLEDETKALSISYTPWLNELVNDINLAYLSFAYKLNNKQALGFAMRYFSLGDIKFTDNDGNPLGEGKPYEVTFNGAYALKVGERVSLAVGLRYIFSDITNGYQTTSIEPGKAFAADLGVYYKSREVNMDGGLKQAVSLGANFSNIGSKISYGNDAEADFIPANLRLGGAYHLRLDKYNRIAFMVEANKLLVPTPPVREGDEGFTGDRNGNGSEDDGSIIAGKDDDVSSFQGVIQSFTDAPGGAREEFEEVQLNGGLEFWYDEKFALRGGYQWEHAQKGGRQYFTMGLGIKFNVLGVDFAYLIPASATVKSPLENTLRFTIRFDFEGGDS